MKRPFMNLRWRLLARARETLTKPDRRYIMASNHNTQGNQGNQGSNDGHTKSASQGSNKQSDTSNRGFASMDPDQQREIASEGGKAAHAAGTAHEFTSEEARKAGSMSHKNDGNQQSGSSTGGSQNSGNTGNTGSSGNQASSGSTRGGTPEQHAQAGRQSHKNDR